VGDAAVWDHADPQGSICHGQQTNSIQAYGSGSSPYQLSGDSFAATGCPLAMTSFSHATVHADQHENDGAQQSVHRRHPDVWFKQPPPITADTSYSRQRPSGQQ
jgi:hypothetical protein